MSMGMAGSGSWPGPWRLTKAHRRPSLVITHWLTVPPGAASSSFAFTGAAPRSGLL
jgi:hypothetical protein